MSDNVVQRARQALDGITEGQWWWSRETRARLIAGGTEDDLTDAREIIRCAALLHPGVADAGFIAAAPDLIRGLLAHIDVVVPSALAQRDDAWQEVERLRATIERVRDLADAYDSQCMLSLSTRIRRALNPAHQVNQN